MLHALNFPDRQILALIGSRMAATDLSKVLPMPIPATVVGFLQPHEVCRFARTCRDYAAAERSSRAWRDAAWSRYTVFGMKPQEPKETEAKFHWWSVDEVSQTSNKFPRAWRDTLRGLLDRPAPLKIIALDGIHEDEEQPIRRGGLLADIARSKRETLDLIDLSAVKVTPAALEECLRLVPNLRSLIMSDETSFVTEDNDFTSFDDVRVVHNGLHYLRWGGYDDFSPEVDLPRCLQNFPNLRVLDLSEVRPGGFGYARNLCRRLAVLKNRSGHTNLVSILVRLSDADLEAEDFDECFLNALQDQEEQTAELFKDDFDDVYW